MGYIGDIDKEEIHSRISDGYLLEGSAEDIRDSAGPSWFPLSCQIDRWMFEHNKSLAAFRRLKKTKIYVPTEAEKLAEKLAESKKIIDEIWNEWETSKEQQIDKGAQDGIS